MNDKKTLPLVITISHQFGSGGSYVGQNLAEKLRFLYLDRELIVKTADKLGVLEDTIMNRDEKTISTLETLLRAYSYSDIPMIDTEDYKPDYLRDEDIFKAEAEILTSLSAEKSFIVLGRGSSYILRKHPRNISIYLHSDINTRVKRISKSQGISESQALKLVQTRDKERLHYIQKFTKEDLYNANMYDLAFNTSRIELDDIISFIQAYVEKRYPSEI